MKTLLSITALFFSALILSAEPPPLSLAKSYRSDLNLNDYWVSEKLDGVRAYWNGEQLVTRKGNIIHAPQWFLNTLPSNPLDGELWIERGKFEETVSTVRKHHPLDHEWANIRYMIFDLPSSPLRFDERLKQLKILLTELAPTLQLIPHWKVPDHAQLLRQLHELTNKNAEGLMLHRGNSFYTAGRQNDVIKLKLHDDAEAIVIAHNPGNGKYWGLMGSLLVKDFRGKQFYIGTGFTDQQRLKPPAIGSIITFRYNGLTSNGIPRHARFLRTRTDHDL